MTSDSLLESDINKEFIRALTDYTDDLSIVILVAAHTERFVELLLKSRMPNWTKSHDPLTIDGLPLSLGIGARWAYALGYLDFPTFEICMTISRLRNEAAHLKRGADFKLATPVYADRVTASYEKHARELLDKYVRGRVEKGTPIERARFVALLMYVTGRIAATVQ